MNVLFSQAYLKHNSYYYSNGIWLSETILNEENMTSLDSAAANSLQEYIRCLTVWPQLCLRGQFGPNHVGVVHIRQVFVSGHPSPVEEREKCFINSFLQG